MPPLHRGHRGRVLIHCVSIRRKNVILMSMKLAPFTRIKIAFQTWCNQAFLTTCSAGMPLFGPSVRVRNKTLRWRTTKIYFAPVQKVWEGKFCEQVQRKNSICGTWGLAIHLPCVKFVALNSADTTLTHDTSVLMLKTLHSSDIAYFSYFPNNTLVRTHALAPMM